MAAVACFNPPSSHVSGHVSVIKRSEANRSNKRGRVKSVTWASRDQICQVRLFLSDNCPSILGPIQQDLIRSNDPRKNVSGNNHHNSMYDIPQRFHAKRARTESELNMCPEISWSNPPKFLLDATLFMASGEESSEVAVQQKRELSVLEAFYPRLTSIPECPLELLENGTNHDEVHIPEVPLTPHDDEEDAGIISTSGTDAVVAGQTSNSSVICHPSGSQGSADVEHKIAESNISGDIAAAVCMAIDELGAKDLVDQQLLFEILRNPSLIKSLTSSNLSLKESTSVTNANMLVDKSCQEIEQCPTVEQRVSDGPFDGRATFHVDGQFHPSSSMHHSSTLVAASLPNGNGNGNGNGNANQLGNCHLSIPSSHFYPTSNGVYQSEVREMAPQGTVRGYSDPNHHFSQCNSPFPAALQRGVQMSQFHESGVSDATPLAQTCRDAARQGNGIRGNRSVGNPSRKLCMYFNTPRGCRNGDKCAFRH